MLAMVRAVASVAIAAMLGLPTVAPAGTQPDPDVAAALRAQVERLKGGHEVRVGQSWLSARHVLPFLYESVGHRPLWSAPEAIDQLMVAIDSVYDDGLDPEDYHLSQLVRAREAESATPEVDPELQAGIDLLRSDALLRLERHLRYGKVDPISIDASWDFLGERAGIAREEEALRILAAIDAGRIAELVAAARPQSEIYSAMRTELARLRAIAAAGGWTRVPEGATLREGDRDFRVMALRARLGASGDLDVESSAAGTDPTLYDEALVESITRFQRRHGIAMDGVTGPKTLETLRASPEFWIDQLRVNMERARWLRSRFEHGVIVNIAGFDARYVRSGNVVWQGRAAVGTRYRETPILRATIRSLVLNPTWTVPPTILEHDILPEARKDPGYLDRRGLRMFTSAGDVVDATSVDWTSLRAAGFPYTLRQGPGPENPLGRIKFLFPNPHFVYMHDTPSRSQFHRADRAASSGCIRIEKPLELAELLLEGTPGWNRKRLDETIASGKTTAVSLARPVPVYLLYATAGLNDDGTFRFSRDIYDRDRAVLSALDRAHREGDASLTTRQMP
jgi:murein L,D-transpeptidase YcbB/YkuD